MTDSNIMLTRTELLDLVPVPLDTNGDEVELLPLVATAVDGSALTGEIAVATAGGVVTTDFWLGAGVVVAQGRSGSEASVVLVRPAQVLPSWIARQVGLQCEPLMTSQPELIIERLEAEAGVFPAGLSKWWSLTWSIGGEKSRLAVAVGVDGSLNILERLPDGNALGRPTTIEEIWGRLALLAGIVDVIHLAAFSDDHGNMPEPF